LNFSLQSIQFPFEEVEEFIKTTRRGEIIDVIDNLIIVASAVFILGLYSLRGSIGFWRELIILFKFYHKHSLHNIPGTTYVSDCLQRVYS